MSLTFKVHFPRQLMTVTSIGRWLQGVCPGWRRETAKTYLSCFKACLSSSQLTAAVQKRKGKNGFIPGLELRVGKGDDVS